MGMDIRSCDPFEAVASIRSAWLSDLDFKPAIPIRLQCLQQF